MSYRDAQQTRQKILDWLHDNPDHGVQAICTGISKTRNHTMGGLRTMTARGEVLKLGEGFGSVYRAIATTTVSAEQIISEIRDRQKKGKEKVPVNSTPVGYYIHSIDRNNDGTVRMPIIGQGGQGAVRSRVYVGSSAGMI